MRRGFLVALLLLLVPGTGLLAVENGRQSFTIVRAEQKTRDRVVYWVVDTPIYHEDPYFEVEVRAAGTILVGEYEPRHAGEMLPATWRPGALVQGRVGKRHLFLRRPDGTDLSFVITRRAAAPREKP
ncbi:MAG: hypothetical protein WCC22_04615 [Terriglobales bacterium]